MTQIQIVGMGCPKCRQMTADVERIVTQMGLEAEIGRIEDPQTIVQLGIISVPQMMIDGQLVKFRYRDRRSIQDVLRRITS
jgi:small redox-active disulfide protein 2